MRIRNYNTLNFPLEGGTSPDARAFAAINPERICKLCGHWDDEHTRRHCDACRIVGNPAHRFTPERTTE